MDGNGDEKRVILYARCSSDDRSNDGRNLASQLEMAREYARSKGYRIIAEIAEDDQIHRAWLPGSPLPVSSFPACCRSLRPLR